MFVPQQTMFEHSVAHRLVNDERAGHETARELGREAAAASAQRIADRPELGALLLSRALDEFVYGVPPESG